MRRLGSCVALVALSLLVLSSASAAGLPGKVYSVQETTRCAYAQGCPRMLRNALSHAEQYCREEGGPLRGGSRRDFRCEQRGIYCVVTGRIECRGRFDPTEAPGPPVTGDQPARAPRTRTCLDEHCTRFVSHAPGLVEEGLHVCPYGTLVVGVSGLGNDLVCQSFDVPVRESRVVRVPRSDGLLACPSGTVVRGASEARDALLCSRLDAVQGAAALEDESGNLGLQVCRESDGAAGLPRFVVGLRPAKDAIVCASLSPRR